MKTFSAYLKEEDIDEGLLRLIKNSFRKLRKKILRSFEKLKMGKTVRVKLNAASSLSEEKADLKSRMGYYSEFCTAYELSKIITSNKASLVGKSPDDLKKIRDSYKKDKLLSKENDFGKDSKKVPDEAKRMEESGLALANSIWSDMHKNIQDLQIIDF